MSLRWWITWGTMLSLSACDGASIVGGVPATTFDAATDASRETDVVTADTATDRGDPAFDAPSPDAPLPPPDLPATDQPPGDAGDVSDAAGDDVSDAAGDDVTDAAGEDVSDVVPGDVPDLTPTSIDTTGPMRVRAGESISVTCEIRNMAGDLVPLPMGANFETRVTPADAVRAEGGNLVAVRAGPLQIVCATASLVDASPLAVEVVPGDPTTVTASLQPTRIIAGEGAEVRCAVSDAFGNAVTPTMPPTISVEPMDMQTRVEGPRVISERSGTVAVTCVSDTLRSTPVSLEVQPAAPAVVRIERSPDRETYAPNEPITIVARVQDRFGNAIEGSMVEWTSSPEGATREGDTWRFARGGRYMVQASVRPSPDAMPITASTTVVVDGTGPGIVCVDPADVSTPDLSPGSPAMMRIQVRDESGISNVTVAGAPVTPDGTGLVTTMVNVRQGLNVIPVSATDRNGSRTNGACVFIAASRWLSETSSIGDLQEFRIAQSAIDDGAPSSPITSLNDMLSTAANSATVRNTVRNALLANRTIYPRTCFQTVSIPFVGTQCLAAAGATLDDVTFDGATTTSLTLVDGGVRAVIRITNVVARFTISGTVAGLNITRAGTATLPSAEVSAIFDLRISGGQLVASPRGAVTTSVAALMVSIPNLPSQVSALATNSANNLRPRIESAVRDNLSRVLSATVSGLASSLDVGGGQVQLSVPRAESSARLTLTVASALSSVNTTSARIRLQSGTRVNANTVARNTALRGVPTLVPGAELVSSRPMLSAVHVGFVAQTTVALWRAGWFDQNWSDLATISPGAMGSLTLRAPLPPAITLDTMGRVLIDIVFDASFSLGGAASTSVRIAARISALPTQVNSRVQFSDVNVTELLVYGTDRSLDTTQTTLYTNIARLLLSRVIGSGLGPALPPLPTPSFLVPSSLSMYGLPAGSRLILNAPTLFVRTPWLALEGSIQLR
jgi:hypothetical protein